jgi:murein DD-endopeptidase MepM/ murein hydrolase activator NlpD
MQGPAEVVQVVLEADTITDLTDRVTFIDYFNKADANLAVGIDTERQQLERFKGTLSDLRKQQKRLIRQLKQQSDQLQERWKAQAAVAAEIQGKLDEAKEVVKDLEAKWQRQLLASLAAQGGGRPPPDIDGKPGPFFACPVDRPRSYIDDFGYPRSGGRTHQGNDILAPKGTRIRAPFDGRAVEGSNSLGGLSVHVYGGPRGDYVYNAHLSRYAGVSGHVRAGQVIGYVGDTGNARGGPYHDHFEYHPGGGSAISPYHYLNEVCGVGGG